MKKMIAALLALMMALLCVPALAEEEALRDRFDSVWRNGFDSVEVNCMDGYWEVLVSLEGGTLLWDYTCVYDAELDALVSDPEAVNRKFSVALDENGAETGRETLAENISAAFTVEEDGKLMWADTGEEAAVKFEKTGWFAGTFGCDNFFLRIDWDTEVVEEATYSGYKAVMEMRDDNVVTWWTYTCAYNPENNTLEAVTATKDTQAADGEAITTLYEEYAEDDRCPAVFSWDEEGSLIWTDNVENVGEGMAFTLGNG